MFSSAMIFVLAANEKAIFAFLQASGQQAGFQVERMPSITLDEERISSTRVRHALRDGNLNLVERLLNHPFQMEGKIVLGHQRGRHIGFPTANIRLHRAVTPLQGVFAVRMYGVTDKPLLGVANVGVAPYGGWIPVHC